MRRSVKLLGALLLVVALATAQTAQRANSATASDDRFFVDKLYPVLEAAECRMCHNDNGVASATRVHFPLPDAKPDAIRAFGLGLSAVVDRNNPDASLLLRKPTARVAHGGGERIKKGTPEEAALQSWIAYLAKLTPADLNTALSRLKSDRGPAATTAVRRLTHSQYNNTVRDLLGDFTRPADQFPQEDYLHGFTNQAEGQSIPPILAEAYTVASEKLAATAFRHGDTQGLAPCKASSPSDAACRDRFIREFGLKAFRRPLTPKETSGYTTLFTQTATQKKDFLAGAQLVVEAMLQSPSFLFHLEDGPNGASRQYGIASRLSYFLWDTMPDAELLRAAAAGEFETAANIRKVALRMMDTPQARRAFEGFVGQWTRFDRVLASVRNARQYTDFNPSLLASMTAETKHLFNHLVWGDKNFMEMFSADYTFLSARLAQLYGLDAPSEDFGIVKYPAGSTRAGILGHAGFLTLTGNPTETSPTARGLYVRENFLCQEVPPPPAGCRPHSARGLRREADDNAGAFGSPCRQSELLELSQPDRSHRIRSRRFRQRRPLPRKSDHPDGAVTGRGHQCADRVEGYRSSAGHQGLHPGNSQLGILERGGIGKDPRGRPHLPKMCCETDFPLCDRPARGRVGPEATRRHVRRLPEIRFPFPGTGAGAGDVRRVPR